MEPPATKSSTWALGLGGAAFVVSSLACTVVAGVDDLQSGPTSAGGAAGHGGFGGGAPPTSTTLVTTSGDAGSGGQANAGGGGGAGGDPCAGCAPSGPCDAVTCAPDTGCQHVPKPAGDACDDGDACTVGDQCGADGACAPGPVCPNSNPCKTSACKNGACATSNLANGTSCGATSSARCCGGTCIDTSKSEAHCGVCAGQCANGEVCESVAATNTCASSPSNVSGRCTCDTNADCPLGQVCRTFEPFSKRCSPEGVGDCGSGAFKSLDACPNYCLY